LKEELLRDLDILIVRELAGGLYFGKPRGRRENAQQAPEAFNTMVYSQAEVQRIAHVAFEAASERSQRVCSVDKANVLETSVLWRETVNEVAREYPRVELQHMYVDNAAMQLVAAPTQFDVILTENMFGDILSDLAAVLVGSIGMLASGSLGAGNLGLYEPCHGAAPDIAGKDTANPLAAILCVAMMLRNSLDAHRAAEAIELALADTLKSGHRTADIVAPGKTSTGCAQMGEQVLQALGKRLNT
jgi:3-isopropylmalate dehydrogenase